MKYPVKIIIFKGEQTLMGNLKRFLAMTLTMLMVVGCFAMTGSVAAFDDVVDYQKQINLMSVLEIIKGYDDEGIEFGPQDDVERYQMAVMIAKIMTGKTDAYVSWYNTINNTDFVDVEQDHFFGSISYCNENGVVIGTSATTFEPAAGIMIQDVFTMVVRMLGYGSASMDANYPWSYVDKAIQLGLDADLDALYNIEDVATREQAAVILYNALFAKKADGTTYAASKFNLTIDTVVLTGTSKANMFASGDVEGKTLAKENYVAFNQLNEDGTMGSETFYLLKSWFGFGDEIDENLYFGQSYKVITKDNYTTIIYCEAIEGVWLDQTEFDGVKDAGRDLKVEGLSYKAVDKFSYLNYAQGSKTTDELEVIVYDVNNRVTVNDVTSYIMDSSRNIMKANGKDIALKYVPGPTSTASSWKDDYKKEVEIDGVKVLVTPSQGDWDGLAVYVHSKHTGAMRKLGSDLSTGKMFAEYNAYSDTVLYDDNSDGIYDRAMYRYYSFGFISYNDDKHLTMNGAKMFGDTAYTDASITYVTADGEVLEAADVVKALDSSLTKGNYVLYSVNPANKYVMIKEFFTPNQGLVTGLDKPNGTITFDQVYYNITAGNVAGTKFAVGNAKLPGATKNEVIAKIPNGNLDELQGRNVHYIEKDGSVLAIYEAYNNAGKYFVFDRIVGINSTGYVNALVYLNNTRSVITIASLDGDWYGADFVGYYSNAEFLGSKEAYGLLFSYTTDALGNYHAKYISAKTDFQYYYNRATYNNVWLQFQNGISFPVFNGNPSNGIAEITFFDNAKGVAKAFNQFNTNNDTVIVVNNDGELTGYKGVPVNGAKINLYKGAKIFVDQTNDDNPTVAKFIYVINGSFADFATTQVWNTQSNDTVIFVDDDTFATEVITNQTNTGYGVTLGTVYSYNKAIDFVRGGFKEGILTYNGRLSAGKFYLVKDNYVEKEIARDDHAYISSGNLVYIDTYEAVVQSHGFEKEVINTNYRTNYLYQLKGTEITDTKANNEDITPKNFVKDEKGNVNTDGNFAYVYYYAGSIEAPANVFIFEEVKAGAKAPAKYLRNDWIAENVVLTGWDDVVFTNTVTNTNTKVSQQFSMTIPVFTSKLENYKFSGIHSPYGAYNWYEIDINDYNRLSSMGYWSNDGSNHVLKTYGVNFQLLDPDGKIVEGFNEYNVLAFTKMMQTNGGGTKYFLVFTSPATGFAQRIGGQMGVSGTGVYTLRYTQSESITPYEIKLSAVAKDGKTAAAGFGLDPFRWVSVTNNLMEIVDDPDTVVTVPDNAWVDYLEASMSFGQDRVNLTSRPWLFGNYAEMFTGTQAKTFWDNPKTDVLKDSFYQYVGNYDFADETQLSYRWVGFDANNNYKMYLRVPHAIYNNGTADTEDDVTLGYTLSGFYYNEYTDFTGPVKDWGLVKATDVVFTKIDTVNWQKDNHDVWVVTFPAGVLRNVVLDVTYDEPEVPPVPVPTPVYINITDTRTGTVATTTAAQLTINGEEILGAAGFHGNNSYRYDTGKFVDDVFEVSFTLAAGSTLNFVRVEQTTSMPDIVPKQTKVVISGIEYITYSFTYTAVETWNAVSVNITSTP